MKSKTNNAHLSVLNPLAYTKTTNFIILASPKFVRCKDVLLCPEDTYIFVLEAFYGEFLCNETGYLEVPDRLCGANITNMVAAGCDHSVTCNLSTLSPLPSTNCIENNFFVYYFCGKDVESPLYSNCMGKSSILLYMGRWEIKNFEWGRK